MESVRAGISPVDFWRLTPYLTRKSAPALHDSRTTAAWLTASLSRAKKIPKLSELTTKKQVHRSQSEMEESLKSHLAGMARRKK